MFRLLTHSQQHYIHSALLHYFNIRPVDYHLRHDLDGLLFSIAGGENFPLTKTSTTRSNDELLGSVVTRTRTANSKPDAPSVLRLPDASGSRSACRIEASTLGVKLPLRAISSNRLDDLLLAFADRKNVRFTNRCPLFSWIACYTETGLLTGYTSLVHNVLKIQIVSIKYYFNIK